MSPKATDSTRDPVRRDLQTDHDRLLPQGRRLDPPASVGDRMNRRRHLMGAIGSLLDGEIGGAVAGFVIAGLGAAWILRDQVHKARAAAAEVAAGAGSGCCRGLSRDGLAKVAATNGTDPVRSLKRRDGTAHDTQP